MLAVERRQRIVERVYRERRVVVAELAAAFGVTEETIRRDLQRLEDEGLVERAHGGAVARETAGEDLPYRMRQTANIEAKRRIAGLAAGLVADGAALMLDSSSTAFELLRPLQERRDLTLITNSVRILAEPDATHHAVISVGGELRRRSMTFVGPIAGDGIGRFNADIAFVSCKGLSPEAGITDVSLPDAEVKRAFIRHARRVCLLADAEKFGRVALAAVCDFGPVDTLVTDRRPAPDWVDFLKEKGVALVC